MESKKDMHETFGSSEEVFRRVTVVVEQLTKASAPRGMVGVEEHLAQAPLSELKQLVRSSDATMHHVIHILLRRIALPHSLVREVSVWLPLRVVQVYQSFHRTIKYISNLSLLETRVMFEQ